MRTIILILVWLLLSSVVAAKGLKSTPIARSALQKLLGTQAQAVLRSLNNRQVVITAVHEASPLNKSDFDLYMLADEFSSDEHSIVEMLKAVVNGQEDNLGYIFVPTADNKIERYEYIYYTRDRRERVEIEGSKEKIDVRLTHDDIVFLSDDYSLEDALRDNRFYMERYIRENQSSVRYLKELRAELNGKLSEELDVELRRHNLGEVLIGSDYLSKIEALVSEADAAAQRRWQKALSALKAEIAAEELVVRLRKGELKQEEDIPVEQVEAAERVVRLKDASIAKRNKDVHGQVHFYAFRIPHTYLHNLLDRYAKTKGLSDEQKQALLHSLFHEQEVNYKAVKFGQTDSMRAKVSELTAPEQKELSQELANTMPEDKYQEIVEQTGIPRQRPRKAKSKSTQISSKISNLAREIDLSSGKVEVRIEEQLRDIIDVSLLKKIGGDTTTLVKEAKLLAYAPSSDSSMLDKDILHYLFGGDVKAARMVAGKPSNETVVFLHEGEELELNEDVIELVRNSFKESVEQFGDYLDRRGRDSIVYPRFSNYVRQHKKVAKPITPLQQVWQEFFDAIRSNNKKYSNFANYKLKKLKELGLASAYNTSLNNQVITHTHFTNIENAIEGVELDKEIAQKLLQEFAEFTPVIANPKLMSEKIKQGGEKVIDTSIDYAKGLSGKGFNTELENLTMIYRGLQELGDEALIEHFEGKVGEEMLKNIKIQSMWQELFDVIRSNKEKYSNFTNIELKRTKELILSDAYDTSRKNQTISHTHFTKIEGVMKEWLDNGTVQELLEKFSEFTPVISNPKLMAEKIKQGGEDALNTSIEYARNLTDKKGIKRESLTMIYHGLQELGDEALSKYLKKKLVTAC